MIFPDMLLVDCKIEDRRPETWLQMNFFTGSFQEFISDF